MLSPDILVTDANSTQSYNRYSYCSNNPLSLTDPTGYRQTGRGGFDVASANGAVIKKYYYEMFGDGNNIDGEDFGRAGGGGGGGNQFYTSGDTPLQDFKFNGGSQYNFFYGLAEQGISFMTINNKQLLKLMEFMGIILLKIMLLKKVKLRTLVKFHMKEQITHFIR